jgi:hypothetical protein
VRTLRPAVMALVWLLSACGTGGEPSAPADAIATSPASNPSPRVLRGTIDAHPYVLGENHTCTTPTLSIGTTVTVRDESGRTIGTDSINRSETTADMRIDEVFRCRLYWSVEVPPASSYQVNVGTEPPSTFTAADVEAANWEVKMVSGDCREYASCQSPEEAAQFGDGPAG